MSRLELDRRLAGIRGQPGCARADACRLILRKQFRGCCLEMSDHGPEVSDCTRTVREHSTALSDTGHELRNVEQLNR